jgi:membrane protein
MAGFTALMKALNEVYGVRESRPYLRRLLLSAAITASIGTLLLTILVLTLVRQIAGEGVADLLGVPAAVGYAADLLSLLASIPILIGATAVLYGALPDRHSGTHVMSLGALMFVVGWLGGTLLFGAYLANFPSYANVYGVIGTLLVLLTWFFITSFALLLGAEVDAMRGRRGHF